MLPTHSAVGPPVPSYPAVPSALGQHGISKAALAFRVSVAATESQLSCRMLFRKPSRRPPPEALCRPQGPGKAEGIGVLPSLVPEHPQRQPGQKGALHCPRQGVPRASAGAKDPAGQGPVPAVSQQPQLGISQD